MGDTWFSQIFRELASQLSSGALNEMKKRIIRLKTGTKRRERTNEGIF